MHTTKRNCSAAWHDKGLPVTLEDGTEAVALLIRYHEQAPMPAHLAPSDLDAKGYVVIEFDLLDQHGNDIMHRASDYDIERINTMFVELNDEMN